MFIFKSALELIGSDKYIILELTMVYIALITMLSSAIYFAYFCIAFDLKIEMYKPLKFILLFTILIGASLCLLIFVSLFSIAVAIAVFVFLWYLIIKKVKKSIDNTKEILMINKVLKSNDIDYN